VEKSQRKPAKRKHDELSTIRKVEELIEKLDPPSARPRVLKYLMERFQDRRYQDPVDPRQAALFEEANGASTDPEDVTVVS
jgi:hypothetical protein